MDSSSMLCCPRRRVGATSCQSSRRTNEAHFCKDDTCQMMTCRMVGSPILRSQEGSAASEATHTARSTWLAADGEGAMRANFGNKWRLTQPPAAGLWKILVQLVAYHARELPREVKVKQQIKHVWRVASLLWVGVPSHSRS